MSARRLDPVTLQVLIGALRSACEEMGAGAGAGLEVVGRG